jgi:tripartite-type tricarboxylate transporter receptor subunit TctC
MGVKSVGDFNLELLQALTGVKLTIVPFKGASPTIPALLGGHVDVVSVTLPVYINQMRGGDVKGIVISKNFPEFPDIPTLKQLVISKICLKSGQLSLLLPGSQRKQLKPWFRPLTM